MPQNTAAVLGSPHDQPARNALARRVWSGIWTHFVLKISGQIARRGP